MYCYLALCFWQSAFFLFLCKDQRFFANMIFRGLAGEAFDMRADRRKIEEMFAYGIAKFSRDGLLCGCDNDSLSVASKQFDSAFKIAIARHKDGSVVLRDRGEKVDREFQIEVRFTSEFSGGFIAERFNGLDSHRISGVVQIAIKTCFAWIGRHLLRGIPKRIADHAAFGKKVEQFSRIEEPAERTLCVVGVLAIDKERNAVRFVSI